MAPRGEQLATATGNMYRKFGEIRIAVFEICERIDRQTDTLIAILRIRTGSEAN